MYYKNMNCTKKVLFFIFFLFCFCVQAAFADFSADINQARQAILRGKFDEGIALYSRALDFFEGTQEEKAKMFYERGLAFKQANKMDQAASDFVHVIELQPDYPGAHIALGDVYDSQQKFDLAIQSYSKTIQLDAKSPAAYHNRGLTYRKMGKMEKALSDYSNAISIDHQFVPSYYNRSFLYHYVFGDSEKALQDCDQILNIEQSAKAYKVKGIILYEIEKYSEAEEMFSMALMFEPTNAELYHYRFMANEQLGNNDEALLDKQSALEHGYKY